MVGVSDSSLNTVSQITLGSLLVMGFVLALDTETSETQLLLGKLPGRGRLQTQHKRGVRNSCDSGR